MDWQTWRRDQPAASGWYFFEPDDPEEWHEVLDVQWRDGQWQAYYRRPGEFVPLSEYRGWFAGPIPEPEIGAHPPAPQDEEPS